MTQPTAALVVLTSIITLTKSSKQRGIPSVTAVCAHEDTSYCAAATQLNFEFSECVAYACLCACRQGRVRVQRQRRQRRLVDWICQPAGTLITSAISRLTSHNRSHLWEWNDFGHSGSPQPGQSLRFKSATRKRGNRTVRTQESHRGFPLENFVPLKQFFPVSFSETTMANNKGSDVNHHFWVRKQRKLAVRKF